MREAFVSSITGCVRCHGSGHENVTWQPLVFSVTGPNGSVLTHWAPCPTNGEPILTRSTTTTPWEGIHGT